MKLAVIILLLLLTSCGQQKDPREDVKEQPSKSVFKEGGVPNGPIKCVDGASYEGLYGGWFLRFKDGKYITC